MPHLTRRTLIQSASLAAFTKAAPKPESKDTPKICLEAGVGGLSAGTIDEAGCRKIKQLGVDYVLTGGPRIPWDENQLRAMMDKLQAGGLTLGNLMIAGFPNTIYGRPGR